MFQTALEEWLHQDEAAVLEALGFKMRLPTGSNILAELINLNSSEENKRYAMSILTSAQELAVQFITK